MFATVLHFVHDWFHSLMTDFIPTTTAFVMAQCESDNTCTACSPADVLLSNSHFSSEENVCVVLIQASVCSKPREDSGV